MTLNKLQFMIIKFLLRKKMDLNILKTETKVKINLLYSGYLLNTKKLWFLKKY